ncbi:MAG: PorP/SprF family type IX secretion system membrane protein [Flavobacteriales bacterium]|nr:PorP/SprF family type IX secretion system membrane protein [Flavobacteriales bacterium]
MKRFLITLLFILTITQNAFSQQQAQFSQYYYNKTYYNTAFSTMSGKPQLNATFRGQWVGVDGAPQTAGINAMMPLFSTRGSGSANIYYDRVGNFTSLLAKIGYAYALPVGRSVISMGLSGGVYSLSVRDDWITPDPSDPSIPYGAGNSIAPTVGVGIGVYSEKYYVGLSSHNILEFKNAWDDVSVEQKNHLYLMGGYAFSVGKAVVITPSGLLSTDMNTFCMAVNASAVVNKKIIAGLSYRTDDSMGLNVGYVFGRVQLCYSYEVGLSPLSQSGSGSHELLVMYTFSPKVKKVKEEPDGTVKNIRFL